MTDCKSQASLKTQLVLHAEMNRKSISLNVGKKYENTNEYVLKEGLKSI